MADTQTKRKRLWARESQEIASFAITQPQRVKVHSAALRKVGERNKNERVSHVDDGWQRLAYQHARLIGEVGYVFQMKANLIARCPLNPQHFVDGHWINKEDEDEDPGWEKVERVMAAFVGPVGGAAELKRRFALHISIGGEALDLDTLIPTPDGFKRMGELAAGDVVLGGDGRPCNVVYAHPVLYDRDCYEVRLTGDIRIVADAGHKWVTRSAVDRARTAQRLVARGKDRSRIHHSIYEDIEPRVVTTEDMANTLRYGANGVHANHAIDVSAVEGSDPVLGVEIDPYLLGYWLGDGHSAGGRLTIHTDDQQHVRGRVESAGYGWKIQPGDPRGYLIGVKGLQGQLRRMGLLNNKHIPRPYLRHTQEARWALLQGLIDSDGHVDRKGRVEFANFNPRLLWDVVELAASLGLKPGRPSARRFSFPSAGMPVASLPRKAERIRPVSVADGHRCVQSVEPVKSRPVRCITVDSPDHTYLVTDRMIRTHNTTLLGTPSQNESGLSTGINWEFVSTQELRVTQGSKPTRNADGGQSKELGEEVFLARCWRADPEFSGRSDSAMRRIELVCQELLKLTQMVMAIADSRLPAKILYLSDGLTLPGGDESEPSDDDDQPDSFVEGLYDHLAAPKDDPTSQTTILPFVMRGPPHPEDHIAIYDLGRDQDTWAKDLREEALDRIAAGLEVPKETMKGKSGLSGLGGGNVAQAIDDDLIQRHVIPDGEMMAEFVSFAYTRPMLEDFEDMNQEESSTWRVAFDPGPIQTKMDEGTSARRLHSLSPDILSNNAVRNSNGFDDSDKPTDEEVQERRMWDLLKANPSTLGPVIGPILVPGVDWSQVATGQTDNPVQSTGLPENEVAAESDSKPDQGLSLLLERLTVAGDACLDRAFDRAGSIVVTRCQKDPSLRDRTRSVPKAKAPSMLTPAEAVRFTLTPDVLLANAWEAYGLKARGWVRDYLEAQGEDRRYADDIASEASRLICASLHRLASEHLPRGLPSPVGGLRVQRELVEKALANAGVLGLE